MMTKKQIFRDLNENLKDHTQMIKNVGKRYYEYDRSEFIKSLKGNDVREKYDTDIETLSTNIIQMILFNRIIYTDENNVDTRTKELIKENKNDIHNRKLGTRKKYRK